MLCPHWERYSLYSDHCICCKRRERHYESREAEKGPKNTKIRLEVYPVSILFQLHGIPSFHLVPTWPRAGHLPLRAPLSLLVPEILASVTGCFWVTQTTGRGLSPGMAGWRVEQCLRARVSTVLLDSWYTGALPLVPETSLKLITSWPSAILDWLYPPKSASLWCLLGVE